MTIASFKVGVTRFELATSRPPDAHSNRTELHPESAKLEPTDIHSEARLGACCIFLAERISFALKREGFPAKAMQNYCFFLNPPNFSVKIFHNIEKFRPGHIFAGIFHASHLHEESCFRHATWRMEWKKADTLTITIFFCNFA